jgi:DNA repair exonuclease SbcCD ATPase subunit
MIHVEITNFQSIRNLSLDIDGYTTIVGRNFIGKSAVLRAINAALTNAQGTNFITWGESFCEVRIKNDKIDLLWHKEEGNNFYVINDKKYSKIGKDDPPDEIFKAGLGYTTVGKDKINLLYVEQFFPLFLVDKKDSKGIDLLTAAYGLDKIYKAVDLCNKDQRTNKDMLRIRSKDLAVLTEDIKKYDGFDEILQNKANLVSAKNRIDQKEKRIEKLKNLLDRILVLSQQVKILQTIKDIEIPKDDKLKDIFNKAKRLTVLNTSLEKVTNEITRVKGIEGITPPESCNRLKDKKNKISKAVDLSTRLSNLKLIIGKLEAITSIDLPDLKISKTGVLDRLESLRKRLIEGKISYQGIEVKYKELVTEEEKLIKEKEEFKGICPLCGSDLKDCEDHNE